MALTPGMGGTGTMAGGDDAFLCVISRPWAVRGADDLRRCAGECLCEVLFTR